MRHKTEQSKSVILYHRAYRKLPGSVQSFFVQFLFLAVPLSALTVFFYPQITRAICLITEAALSPFFFTNTIRIVEVPFIDIVGNISFLDLPGRFPTFFFSLANTLGSLLLLVLLLSIGRAKPVIIFFIIIFSVQLIASAYFLIFPALFPYDAADYSRLYMVQQISIWCFVPLIMGIAILPLPSTLASKIFTMAITYVYSLIFGTVRYAVFLFILAKVSLLYMAILFFALGPLIDFIYIVGIYSVHVTRLAIKTKGDYSLWQWRYSS